MFAVFDHITFDIAISLFQSIAESMLTINSGKDVQKATIVSQITSELNPNFFAIELAHSVNKSAHFIRSGNQSANKKYIIVLFIL